MTEIIKEDDPRLKFVSLEEASTPPSGIIEHIKDYYWIVHPEKGVAFWLTKIGRTKQHISPQCNMYKSIVERFALRYPWAEVKQIPSVFRGVDPNDYI